MDEIISLLEKLNFSKTEAAVYIDLLKNSSSNGYKIAKNLNLSRSSVYSALDNLYKKGIVFLVPGDSQVYKAENPSVLIKKIKHEFNETTDLLDNKLKDIETSSLEERYINIVGYDNIILKIKQLILEAKNEVYINTDINLDKFKDELIKVSNRGVRIIVFSFKKQTLENIPIEIYTHCNLTCEGKETRMMLVVDCEKTLVADRGPHREEFLGVFTENILLASIVSEHIHNDIYLLKLKKLHGDDLINKDIKLNTILENR
ncbi:MULTISPECIES: helix-turn-helix domain-containing protein [unclassified Clostridium]|uniref:TrmB family transcriptional regulator n=1 Tax=unclassified Clostridium TaxID=2614128 RepID=UPI000297D320|nr:MULTISPECIES: helix-turn-helix domain-containing protein [unclassified Clostridium]EKQ55533.1 MAG: putative transcriptional regulator [Clostridium sp. Maddingley MBC34-26]